jgi:hypothetical protein
MRRGQNEDRVATLERQQKSSNNIQTILGVFNSSRQLLLDRAGFSSCLPGKPASSPLHPSRQACLLPSPSIPASLLLVPLLPQLSPAPPRNLSCVVQHGLQMPAAGFSWTLARSLVVPPPTSCLLSPSPAASRPLLLALMLQAPCSFGLGTSVNGCHPRASPEHPSNLLYGIHRGNSLVFPPQLLEQISTPASALFFAEISSFLFSLQRK